MAYEYKVIAEESPVFFGAELNNAGDGWEVISIVSQDYEGLYEDTRTRLVATLRRRKKEPIPKVEQPTPTMRLTP